MREGKRTKIKRNEKENVKLHKRNIKICNFANE